MIRRVASRVGVLIMFLVAVFGVTSCAGGGTPGQNVGSSVNAAVKYVHDDAHKVGCWFYIGSDGHASLSCLPDKDYTP